MTAQSEPRPHTACRIEFASGDDAARIAALSRRHIEQGLAWRYTPERVRALMRSRTHNVVVARADGALVGFAIMRYGDPSANLDLLGVAPPWRGQGVGRRLVLWLEQVATIAGVATIYVQVRERNARAVQFYRRLAYRPIERLPRYYGGAEGAWLLARTLRSPLGPAPRTDGGVPSRGP